MVQAHTLRAAVPGEAQSAVLAVVGPQVRLEGAGATGGDAAGAGVDGGCRRALGLASSHELQLLVDKQAACALASRQLVRVPLRRQWPGRRLQAALSPHMSRRAAVAPPPRALRALTPAQLLLRAVVAARCGWCCPCRPALI